MKLPKIIQDPIKTYPLKETGNSLTKFSKNQHEENERADLQVDPSGNPKPKVELAPAKEWEEKENLLPKTLLTDTENGTVVSYEMRTGPSDLKEKVAYNKFWTQTCKDKLRQMLV